MPGGASVRFAPDLRAGPDCKIGMAREEGVDAVLVLAGQDRAGRVDQPSALFHARGRLIEQLVLQRHSRLQQFRRQAPAQFRLAAPCAGAACRARRRARHRTGLRAAPFPSGACVMIVAPARVARAASCCSAGCRMSQATISPWFCIVAASASDLPPAPAARSRMRSPGRAWQSKRCDLRRFVLEFEGAGFEHRAAPEFGGALAGRDADSDAAQMASARPRNSRARNASRTSLALALQCVHPQIDRRARLKRQHLIEQV